MDIITALKTANIRISCVDRWLYWDESESQWVVAELKYKRRVCQRIYEGASEDKAIAALLG